ncbi:MAG: HNH endonuclease [Myxococcota bacterium]
MSRAQRLLLWAAATDGSFDVITAGDETVLHGKCIHCGRRLAVGLRGKSAASVEHIVPRTHGGTDALANLAVACRPCNHGKGARLDSRSWNDPTLQSVIRTLQERRAKRMREPPEELAHLLPELPC